ncbi:MAG: protoporphyrinogen oxidase HemJ [Gammaproteobacteria bacterium]
MLWVKAFHVIFMVTWFAGLFYLPRLFVYHAEVRDTAGDERFKVMERKLYAIMTIGAVMTVFFGTWLLVGYAWQAYKTSLWLHLKLALVGVLIVYHVYCGRLVRDFREGRNRHGHVWYRWFNEIPALILIAIVILVIVKPF